MFVVESLVFKSWFQRLIMYTILRLRTLVTQLRTTAWLIMQLHIDCSIALAQLPTSVTCACWEMLKVRHEKEQVVEKVSPIKEDVRPSALKALKCST